MLLCACAAGPRITQDEMVQRTQALFSTLAEGNKTPWQTTYADDAIFFDEKGRAMDKKALVDDVQPLPQGYSGTIKVTNPRSLIQKDTAILSYDMDETEVVWGQALTARYHETDTWLLRDGRWQIAATQVLRYYEDPAAGPADVSNYSNYVGTYELSPGNRAMVTNENGKLFLKRGEQPKSELIPEANGIFFRKGVEGRRLFRDNVMIDRRNNEDVVWKKVG
jgi:hypothetical protein